MKGLRSKNENAKRLIRTGQKGAGKPIINSQTDAPVISPAFVGSAMLIVDPAVPGWKWKHNPTLGWTQILPTDPCSMYIATDRFTMKILIAIIILQI